jgi:transposase
MPSLEFSTETIQTLHHERFHHPHPRVQRKMEAVYLMSQGVSCADVARWLQVSRGTLTTYRNQYRAGGVGALQTVNFYRPQSALAAHRDTVEAHFAAHPPTTINHACTVLHELTGIKRAPTQVRQFLHRCGLRCQRVGSLPAKADPVVQAEFLATALQPRLDEAVAGTRQVFFVDAAHFVLGAFLGWLWTRVRVFVRAPSGRQRCNVLGAFNAVTQDILTVTNTTYITALAVTQLLSQIAAQATAGVPITVVLDNARYQRCQLVCAHAAALGIELLFLPSYSPNLNLIERLWKFVKKQCLYSQYYDKFAPFQAAITNCLETAPTTHKKELKSLLTLKFQTFDDVQVMPV